MRYIDILMFILCLNVSLWLLNESGLTAAMGPGAPRVTPNQRFIESFQNDTVLETIDWSNPSILDYMLALGVTAWKSLTMVFALFSQIILVVPTLEMLGIPSGIAYIIAAPIYFIYLWGILQFISGKSGKAME